MPATIDTRYRGQIAQDGSSPPIMVGMIVTLDCGCGCLIGMRMDTREAATAAFHCAPGRHKELVKFFHLSLKESLVEPGERPLVDVVVDLLNNAEKVMGT